MQTPTFFCQHVKHHYWYVVFLPSNLQDNSLIEKIADAISTNDKHRTIHMGEDGDFEGVSFVWEDGSHLQLGYFVSIENGKRQGKWQLEGCGTYQGEYDDLLSSPGQQLLIKSNDNWLKNSAIKAQIIKLLEKY